METKFWESQKLHGGDRDDCHDLELAGFVSICHVSVMGHNTEEAIGSLFDLHPSSWLCHL